MNKKVAVIGAGSWGTSLSFVLANNGYDVFLWSRNPHVVSQINTTHVNEKYLPDFRLPPSITCVSSIEKAVLDASLVLVVVPSHAMRETAQLLSPFISPHMDIVHATKGLEGKSGKTMRTILSEELPSFPSDRLCVLSGPSHAEEVIKKQPTTVVVASQNPLSARTVASYFHNNFFRAYTNDDVLGVELGGALKNIYALASGISDGLGYGDNTKAAIFSRGVSEMSRLGVALGAKKDTFLGLAGVGDLMVTCSSQHSRNWRAGYRLGRGESLQSVINSIGMVVEGIKCTKVTKKMASEYNIEMPLVDSLFDILFNQTSPSVEIAHLMDRMMKEE